MQMPGDYSWSLDYLSNPSWGNNQVEIGQGEMRRKLKQEIESISSATEEAISHNETREDFDILVNNFWHASRQNRSLQQRKELFTYLLEFNRILLEESTPHHIPVAETREIERSNFEGILISMNELIDKVMTMEETRDRAIIIIISDLLPHLINGMVKISNRCLIIKVQNLNQLSEAEAAEVKCEIFSPKFLAGLVQKIIWEETEKKIKERSAVLNDDQKWYVKTLLSLNNFNLSAKFTDFSRSKIQGDFQLQFALPSELEPRVKTEPSADFIPSYVDYRVKNAIRRYQQPHREATLQAIVEAAADVGLTEISHTYLESLDSYKIKAAAAKETSDRLFLIVNDASGASSVMEQIQLELKEVKEPLNDVLAQQDERGRTLLHVALMNGQPDVVSCIIETCDPAAIFELLQIHEGDDGMTALHLTVRAAKTDLIRAFFKDLTKTQIMHTLLFEDRHGSNVLDSALSTRNSKLVAVLIEKLHPRIELINLEKASRLERGNREHVLLTAAQLNLPDSFQILAEGLSRTQYEALFSDVDEAGNTCLHWAIQHNWVEIIRQAIKGKFVNPSKSLKSMASKKKDGQLTLTKHRPNMSKEMAELLIPYCGEYLIQAKKFIMFDNRLKTRENYDREAWRRVGVEAEFFSAWNQEDILIQIDAIVAKNTDLNLLLIVGIRVTEEDGVTKGTQGTKISIDEIIENVLKISPDGVLLKMLLVETVQRDKPSDPVQVNSRIISPNFTLVSAHVDPKENVSYLMEFTDSLMSLRGLVMGRTMRELTRMTVRAIEERHSIGVEALELGFANDFVLYNPETTCAVIHTRTGRLVHGGINYDIQGLVDTEGHNFYPHFDDEVTALALDKSTNESVYSLTKPEIRNKSRQRRFLLHAIDTASRTIRGPLNSYETNGQNSFVLATLEHVIATSRERLRVFSRSDNEEVDATTIRNIEFSQYITELPNGQTLVSTMPEAGEPNKIYCLTTILNEENSTQDWTAQVEDEIHGLAFCELSGHIYALVESSEGLNEIFIFTADGRNLTENCPIKLEEMFDDVSVYDMSIHGNEMAIAAGEDGLHIYYITLTEDPAKPKLVHWSCLRLENQKSDSAEVV